MKQLRVTVNGKAYDVMVEELGGAAPAQSPAAAPAAATAPPPAAPITPIAAESAPAATAAGEGTAVSAPMPGNILDITVKVGDNVAQGQVIAILEAMKMENEICAPSAGTITGIMVAKGDTVDAGTALITIS